MKKTLTIALCLAMVFTFFGCSKGDKAKEGYEVAMITDVGTIDDKSFNQGTWEGVKDWAEKNKVTYKYYQPTEDSNDARLEQIDLAVKNGAKIIATPGFLFNETIFTAQDKYPDVKFILIDGNPTDPKDPTFKPQVKENTVGITFAEQQAGYLAGYAAVMDGYTKLGFMGGMAVPAVVRYGYGFVQGANDAAKEMNQTVDVKYNYTGGFVGSPDIKAKAAGWYSAGTEVIFSCGGAIFDSISAAAEESKGKVIGVDVDQSGQSDTVITSAMKGLSIAVEKALDDWKADKFPGGESWVLGADKDGVGLPMKTSKFKKFNDKDYEKILKELKEDKVTIPTDQDTQQGDLGGKAPNVVLGIVE